MRATSPPETGLLPAGHHVRVNWSRWIADCPDPFCGSAMRVRPGDESTRCLDCGATMGPLIWPPDPDGIETILAMRPDAYTRNWLPGETLGDLLTENAVHGIAPVTDGPLMLAAGDRIIGGALYVPAVARRERRLEIGSAR